MVESKGLRLAISHILLLAWEWSSHRSSRSGNTLKDARCGIWESLFSKGIKLNGGDDNNARFPDSTDT